MVFFKFEEEKYVQMGLVQNSIMEMLNFVAENRFSSVQDLTEESFNNIFQKKESTFILMTLKGGRVIKTFKKLVLANPEVKGIVAQFKSETPSNVEEELLRVTGINVSEFPVLVMLPMNKPYVHIFPKYRTSKLSKNAMEEFFEKSLAGELEYYLRSEILRTDARVNKYTQITLNNFDEFVVKPGKWFLVAFELVMEGQISPELQEVFSQIATITKDLNVDDQLEVGIANLMKNEFSERFQIETLPFIVLFNKGDTQNYERYTGDMKLSKVRRWLQEKTGIVLNRNEIGKPIENEAGNELPNEDL